MADYLDKIEEGLVIAQLKNSQSYSETVSADGSV